MIVALSLVYYIHLCATLSHLFSFLYIIIIQKHLGQSRLLETRPGEIPPGIAPCRGAGPGTGRGDLPLVQPERTGRLCRLGEGRAGPRRSLRRVRHPHVQDRRTGNPRQTLRKQPAAAVRPRAGADGRPSGLQPRRHGRTPRRLPHVQ